MPPLPSDVTPSELAAKEKQPKETRKASSSESYAKIANKWWKKFLKYAQWDAGVAEVFIDEEGSPIDGTFRQLFIYLYEQEVTKSIFKGMLAWAQAKLNEQLRARMLKEREAYVCSLPGIKERKDEIYTNQRMCHMEHMTDLQSNIESDIGFDKMVEMVELCWNLGVPGTSPVLNLQIGYELRATHQQAARHDDLRNEVFAHMFARFSRRVGPSGMPMLCNVTDGGKTNKNGRISYSAVLPNRNPLLCTVFAKGGLFLWRFLVMNSAFPDLLSAEDIFKRPTLRSHHDEMTGTSYISSYNVMKRLFEAVGVVTTKCLHQGRGEIQRFLDDCGVPINQVARLCKYIHDDQTDSYLLNPPIAALLSAALFDHELPRGAYAAHLSVQVTVEVVKTLLPVLVDMQERVEAAFADVHSATEAKAKRLFCARGCGRALRLIVEIFIACSAARARDEAGLIIADSEPMYKRFFVKNRLFQLPFFASAAFLDFAGKVTSAEEREISFTIPSAEAQAISPIQTRLEAQLARHLRPLEAKLDLVAAIAPAQTAAPPVVTAVIEAPASEPGKKKKRMTLDVCTTQAAVKRSNNGNGVPVYMLAQGKTTVKELWEEYKFGLNGGPAVRDLIATHGKKWRAPGDAVRQAWIRHDYIYEDIKRRVSAGAEEEEAVDGLQARLDALTQAAHGTGRGRGRRPITANWPALFYELRKQYPRRAVPSGEL